MKELQLSRGYVALVDDEDFERASQLKWCAISTTGLRTVYAARTCRKTGKARTVYLHRFLTGAATDIDVDHRDGNGLNNCRGNLRLATTSQNIRNQTRKATGCTSRFKGVHRNQWGSWIATIGLEGKRHHLGSFKTEEEARDSYSTAARERFGDFAAPCVEAAE